MTGPSLSFGSATFGVGEGGALADACGAVVAVAADADAGADGGGANEVPDGAAVCATEEEPRSSLDEHANTHDRQSTSGAAVLITEWNVSFAAATMARMDELPDVRDGLTRVERIVLHVLEQTQRELGGRSVPTAMLYGRVVERINISEPELQRVLRRLIGEP
jgi:hypothetical protein